MNFNAFMLFYITILVLFSKVTSIIQPLNQAVNVAFKMCYKRKLVSLTLQQFDNNSVQELGKLNVDSFEAML